MKKTELIEISKIEYDRSNLNQDRIKGFAFSIEEVGLINPITVVRNILNDGYTCEGRGRHRIAAHELLGRTKIEAFVETSEGLKRRSRVIDENLIRNELTVLERAEHVAERFRTTLNKTSLTKKKQKEKIAELIGYTSRYVEDLLKIAGSIDAEVRNQLRKLPVANKTRELKQIAREPVGIQKQVAGILVFNPGLKASKAIRSLRGINESHLSDSQKAIRIIQDAVGKLKALDLLNGASHESPINFGMNEFLNLSEKLTKMISEEMVQPIERLSVDNTKSSYSPSPSSSEATDGE